MHAQLLDAIPLTAISGVGVAIAEKLGKLGILNLQDLLFHLPLRYEDRTRITPIIDLRPEQYATIEGVVQSTEVQFGRRPMLMTYLSDGSAKLALRFFNFNAGMKNSLQPGARVTHATGHRLISTGTSAAITSCVRPLYKQNDYKGLVWLLYS